MLKCARIRIQFVADRGGCKCWMLHKPGGLFVLEVLIGGGGVGFFF